MKKLLALCLAVVMLVGIGLTVSAAPNGFVSSPSGKGAPTIVGAKNENENCPADLIITPYSERNELDAEDRKQIEDAYNSIVNTKDLGDLNSGLKGVAEGKGSKTENFAVSDLFKLGYSDCGDHGNHGLFDITLKPETLKNFVALLRYNNGKWEIVDGATVEGEHLRFKSAAVSSYAILVDTGADSTSPKTGVKDNMIVYYALVMAMSGALAVVFWKKSSKIAE